jgi:hypothetical protein
MGMVIDKKTKAVLASYLRVAIATVMTLILAGESEPKKFVAAVVAATFPPIIRWLNPKDSAYGRGSK